MVFATSALTHYFAPLAHGWSNVLAYPRLWTLVALLFVALQGARRAVGLGLVAAAVVGVVVPFLPMSPPPGVRLPGVSGYLATDPAFCEGVLSWSGLDAKGRLVRRAEHGPPPAACPESPSTSPDGAGVVAAEWRGHSWDVVVRDRRTGAVVRVIGGPANETAPTFAPDGSVVFASDWRRGLGATTLYVASP
jgi:hypothetical protein